MKSNWNPRLAAILPCASVCLCVRGTPGFNARWNFGTRSSIAECITYPRCFPCSGCCTQDACSKHISESLKRCGISESSTYILVARFSASADEMTAIEKLIEGREIDLDDLEGNANQSQIQKHYKISSLELEISSLAEAITCRIAARDAL
ncbi:unnamed protein product [Coffea canephora]|uniref:Uncharacterized protein n=1 Tax=Coffea canephora TaxID=49390 RepID=A0A068TPB1_COFCA|nr:unnamed protein product [Coffea canephora]